MKNFRNFVQFFIVLAMSFAFISCGGDDDKKEDEPTVKSPFVGTWVSSETETEDGMVYTIVETLVFNENNTGYTTITATIDSRASIGQTYREEFSWTETSGSNGNKYISFIHTGGDVIYGNGRYEVVIAGNALNIGGETFIRR